MQIVRYLVWHADILEVFSASSEITAKLTAVMQNNKLRNLSQNYLRNNVVELFDQMAQDGWHRTPVILHTETKG